MIDGLNSKSSVVKVDRHDEVQFQSVIVKHEKWRGILKRRAKNHAVYARAKIIR